MAFETDRYYTGLANRVLKVLRTNAEGLEMEDEDIRDMALRLTAWFEDIISGLGIWHTVNEECRKRYGSVLPYYDTAEYYENEPNIQDLRLLVWDIMQSYEDERFLNPENAFINDLATEVCAIFDDEYETAPETDELAQMLHDRSLLHNYWECRHLIEWLSLSSYISLRQERKLSSDIEEIIANHSDKGVDISILAYYAQTQCAFNGKRNILSLTAAQWLSRISGIADLDSVRIMESSEYRYVGEDDRTVHFQDLITDEVYQVEKDSFAANAFRKPLEKDKSMFSCSLVPFFRTYYQCGMMINLQDTEETQKYIAERKSKHNTTEKGTYELFLKASKGEPVAFVHSQKEMLSFYKRMGLNDVMSQDVSANEKIRHIFDDTDVVAMVGDPTGGIAILPHTGVCIKHKDNHFYSKDEAIKDGVGLILEPRYIGYGAACVLIDENLIPDAAVNNVKGYEYGRQFLHDNAQFMLDYMHHCCREYDYDEEEAALLRKK